MPAKLKKFKFPAFSRFTGFSHFTGSRNHNGSRSFAKNVVQPSAINVVGL